MDRHDLEAIALAVRDELRPGLSPLEPVPLAGLLADTEVAGLTVRAVTHATISANVWGVTTFEPDAARAWIWLTAEAWDEVRPGVARTRFTLAHELGHVVLHGAELVDLFARPEAEHHEELERQANRFAAHLLIPDAGLKRLPALERRAEALARRFGVSVLMAGKRVQEED